MNIADFFSKRADESPDFPAIEQGDVSTSCGELRYLAERMARRLLILGCQPGDIIGIRLNNSSRYCALMWAVARCGCVLFPIKTSLTKSEMRKATAGIQLKVVVIGDSRHAVPRFDSIMARDLIEPLEPFHKEISWPEILPSTPLKMCQSSGTTGKPKTFVFSHSQVIDICRGYGGDGTLNSWLPQDRLFFGHVMSDTWGSEMCISAMFLGVTIVLGQAQSTRDRIEFMRRKKITLCGMGPHRIRALLEHADGKLNQFPDMKVMEVSTSVLYPKELELFHKHFTPNVYNDYGTTEVPFISRSQPGDLDSYPESIGKLYPEVEMEIVDDDHQPVPVGVTGLLRVRSRNMLTEYYQNPEATQRHFRDGWFYPLDHAYLNEDGYIFLQGRADDVINSSGAKFYPVEIENTLINYPGVREAVVLGWPDKIRGEIVVAVITTRSPLKMDKIRAHCLKRLTGNKIPQHILTAKLIPKTAAGKVNLAVLKNMVKARLDKLSSSDPA